MKRTLYTSCAFSLFALVLALTVKASLIRTSMLTMHDGLGSNHVRSIVQDKIGFLWFGTTNGLYRYDGFRVKEIKPSNETEAKLYDDNRVQNLDIWDGRYIIVRRRGRQFSMYDTEKARFVDFSGNGHYNDSFKDFVITGNNDMWLVNDNGPSMHIIRTENKDNTPTFKGQITPKTPQNVIYAGKKWKETRSNKQKRLRDWVKTNLTTFTGATNDSLIITAFEDKNSNVFVSLEDRGIVIANILHNLAEYIYYNNNNTEDKNNNIRVVREEDNGNITIFPKYGNIVCMMYDRDGHKWEGTRQGTAIVDGKTYILPTKGTGVDNKVSYICQDINGRIWITMFTGLLIEAKPKGTNGGYTFNVLRNNLPQPRMIMIDHWGKLWICSAEGLYIYKPQSDKMECMSIGHKNIKVDQIHSVYEDSQNRVWVGTIGFGLAMIDNSNISKHDVKHIYTTADGLPDNRVESVTEDNHGNIWAGTDHGLAMIQRAISSSQSPEGKDGADDSNVGKCYKFFPGTDDLSMMFMENSVWKKKDGKLMFGSKYGAAIVNPDVALGILNNKVHSSRPLVLTDITVNGIDVAAFGDKAPFEGAAYLLKEITLQPEQNSLTFYVSNFDFFSGDRSTFQFYLEGYDKDWQPLQNENYRQYDNLPSGDYTLHVRAQTLNGQPLEQEITLHITILSPIWARWWAIMLYILFFGSIAIIFYRQWKSHEDLKNKMKVEEELTRYKTLFFTNVSHEFRTPLTIIQGSMEAIWNSKRMPADLKNPVSNMKKSSDRLMRLVNQLMDFSKIHEGKLHLRVQDTDIVAFSRDITDVFHTIAEKKNINLTFRTTERQIVMPLDRNMFDKILYNIIGNALKYAPSKGDVQVRISSENDYVTIAISDTGIGIKKEKQEQLFSRFNQSAFITDSIGIGLHMTHEYIVAHHGTITYSANEPTGSIFTVKLPAVASAYSDEERMETNDLIQTADNETESTADNATIPVDYKEVTAPPLNDKTVLIVEDDPDVLEFIRETIASHFNVITAMNGKEGLDIINSSSQSSGGKAGAGGINNIDLIITDIMMPVMSGMEMARKLYGGKEKFTIPMIMLTALSDEERQVKAYNFGVDAFMRKPFSPSLLLAKAIQLIQQRNTLKEVAASSDDTQREAAPTIIIDNQDKRFRANFDRYLTEKLSDSNLSVDMMAEHMKMGRTLFFRRVKEITGKSPNDYIRQRRMERAMILLGDDTLSIQQIASRVGIEDAYYFSKLFKQYTGMTPTAYRKTGGKSEK